MTGENGKTWRFRIRNCQVFYVMNLYVRKDVIGCMDWKDRSISMGGNQINQQDMYTGSKKVMNEQADSTCKIDIQKRYDFYVCLE